MIKAKVNGKEALIEESYQELSFRKYLRLLEMGVGSPGYVVKQSDTLSVFLEIPPEDIKKADFIGLDPVLRAIGFLDKPMELVEYPTHVGPYKIPKDITHESVGQFETMGKYILNSATSETIIDKIKPMAMYCAIYCQPMGLGARESFDEEKASWVSERIMEYSCQEVMSAATFFTLKYVSLKRGLPMNYLYKSIPNMKRRRDLGGFLRRSGFMRLWTILHAIWGSLTRKRLN